jgi:hypothetical protein
VGIRSRLDGSLQVALASLLLLAPAATAPAAGAAGGWAAALGAQLKLYPLMTAEDVYKLAYQAVYGPGHLIHDREAAQRYLKDELAALPPGPDGEPLVEPVGDDPLLVRVNLRPFAARGGDRQRLLDALVTSANSVRGDPERMRQHLVEAVGELRRRGRGADAEALDRLAAEAAASGYPAAHHSAAYRDAYHPAYRVVLLALLAPALP